MAAEFDAEEASYIVETETADNDAKLKLFRCNETYLLFSLSLEKLSAVDDITKYLGIPIPRYFCDCILSSGIS